MAPACWLLPAGSCLLAPACCECDLCQSRANLVPLLQVPHLSLDDCRKHRSQSRADKLPAAIARPRAHPDCEFLSGVVVYCAVSPFSLQSPESFSSTKSSHPASRHESFSQTAMRTQARLGPSFAGSMTPSQSASLTRRPVSLVTLYFVPCTLYLVPSLTSLTSCFEPALRVASGATLGEVPAAAAAAAAAAVSHVARITACSQATPACPRTSSCTANSD